MTAIPAQETKPGFITRDSLPYVLPMAVFLLFLLIAGHVTFLGRWEYLIRIIVLMGVLWFCREAIDFRLKSPMGSIGIGIAVFLVWIGPDALIPGYREHWIFQNSVMGRLKSSIDPALRDDSMVLAIRCFRAAILVPIIEELFWRAWLMRWLVNPDFKRVPMGAYSAAAFWGVAILFGSEHGPYWEVGLAAGILYNWWMLRAKSLGDLILAHGVTNAVLSGYVLWSGKWEYWL